MTIFQTRRNYNECVPDEQVVLSDPTHIELHLSSHNDLVKRYGKAIKAAGGAYSACRGHRTTRYLTLPLRDDTRTLINALVNAYGGPKTTMIARGTSVAGSMSWMDVHYVRKSDDDPVGTFLGLYWEAIQSAVDRDLCDLHEGEPTPVDELLYARRRLEHAKKAVEQAETDLVAARGAEHKAWEAVVRLEDEAR
jgi:hypothetical protein